MNVDYTAFWNELEKIDLGDTLSTLIVKQPGFINLFPTKAPAKALRHEWLEDSLKPKEVAYLSATAEGVFAFEEAKGAKAFEKGDYVAIKGKTATLKVVAVDESAKTVTTTFVAANGSGLAASTLPTEAGTLQFLYHPIAEGSEDGPQKGGKSGKNHNFTQIVRAKVKLSGSLLAIQTHGLENTVIAQSKRALIDVARELDKIAVFGTRAERDVDDECGRAGGLYDFGLSDGAAEVDASPRSTVFRLPFARIVEPNVAGAVDVAPTKPERFAGSTTGQAHKNDRVANRLREEKASSLDVVVRNRFDGRGFPGRRATGDKRFERRDAGVSFRREQIVFRAPFENLFCVADSVVNR